MVFPLKLGILVALVPRSLKPGLPAWLLDDVDQFFKRVCPETLIDRSAYYSADFDPRREVTFPMPHLAF